MAVQADRSAVSRSPSTTSTRSPSPRAATLSRNLAARSRSISTPDGQRAHGNTHRHDTARDGHRPCWVSPSPTALQPVQRATATHMRPSPHPRSKNTWSRTRLSRAADHQEESGDEAMYDIRPLHHRALLPAAR
jgi:hypothetical protein